MSQNGHAIPAGRGRNPREEGMVPQAEAASMESFDSEAQGHMEQVVERENMMAAWKRVKANGGAPGIDGMTVDDLWPWLQEHWSRIKVELLEDRYEPQPVRRVEIPKPGGKGMRELGIPTVLDRLIQQALHQRLLPLFDPDFSDHSYGFRPGRSAQQAAEAARDFVRDGNRWAVDLDLEKFFDRVNHDKLMSRIARKVKDKRILRLIRRYLQAGAMHGDKVSPREEGTPQGGPLSPLLSNILLDDLDRELESRGHRFCRYADDCNIYLRTRQSAERVLASITRYLEQKLKLKVNAEKSAVGRPWNRGFLGYSMTSQLNTQLKVAPESTRRFRSALRQSFRRGRGRNLSTFIRTELNAKLRGWVNYFRISGVKGLFQDLDQWIRRRLRNILWRQWKRPWTRYRKLMQRGLSTQQARQSAWNGRGPWWNAGASHMHLAFPKHYFDALGLVSLFDVYLRFHRGL